MVKKIDRLFLRHVGATADSMTLDQVLASIGVQICFLYGIPYNYAHKVIKKIKEGLIKKEPLNCVSNIVL